MVNRNIAWLLMLSFATIGTLVAGCKPQIEGRPSLVQSERILAIRSVPADAKPLAAVRYESLYVGPDGAPDGEGLDWALCHTRKALTESGSIASACLTRDAPDLEPLGTGDGVQGTVLKDACELFGPRPATPKPGEPNTRPVDPDTTGGYYQTVRVVSDASAQDEYSVGVTRLACGLGGATQEQSADFTKRYRPNENPVADSVLLRHENGDEVWLSTTDSDVTEIVARNEQISLQAVWADCSEPASCGDGICGPGEDSSAMSCPEDCKDPHGCTGSEAYVYFDPLARKLNDRREAMRVSWFATAGRFDHERTGRTEAEASETGTSNPWTAPDESGEVGLWVVIRDDRGGVGWSSYRLQVE